MEAMRASSQFNKFTNGNKSVCRRELGGKDLKLAYP